jgi:hypothetical protein
MKLKIFSDKRYLPNQVEYQNLEHVPILYPFWGKPPEDPEDFRTGRFNRYVNIGNTLLEMTSLDEADLAVIPAYWQFIKQNQVAKNLAIEFIEMAQAAGRRVAIFSEGDWLQEVYPDNTIVFFTSSFQSRRKPNEFAMPQWSLDFISQNFGEQIPIRQKQAKPTVGFCGYAPPMGLPFGMKKLKALARMWGDSLGLTKILSYKTGHTARVRALSALSKSSLIENNFILRSQFAFSNQGMIGVSTDRVENARQQRQEFCQNIIDSDYILCASGYENYSIRFYETLSFGRIPIFINTDCVLPYDFAIDWKKYCVWVEEDEIHLIAEKVAEFHNKLSEQDFMALQYECRKIWQDWISPEGFFANVYRCLDRVGKLEQEEHYQNTISNQRISFIQTFP